MRIEMLSRVMPALLTRMSIVHARGDDVRTLAELALELLERIGPRAGQRHRGALPVQRAGDGAADAARGAGHQRGLAGKIEH